MKNSVRSYAYGTMRNVLVSAVCARMDVANSSGGNFAYAYDALSRPVTRNADAFGYNARSEVASATIGGISSVYGYDEIGNSTNRTANCLNQYAQVDAAQMVYDADGNLVQDDRFTYAYDAENRMLSARPIAPSEGDLAVVNAYDHKHRRIMKRVERFDGEEWQTGETHAFAYDGSNIVLERIAFADGTTRTVECFWGPDLSGTEQGAGGVGGLVAVSVDGAFFTPCYDHNGNIVCYVSESGTIAAQYVYDPFGNVIEQYGTLADRFAIRFSTKYTDIETGLISYLRRLYRPALGRWLNRDPIEEGGGENLYAFCGNAPVLYYDVKGCWALIDNACSFLQKGNDGNHRRIRKIVKSYDGDYSWQPHETHTFVWNGRNGVHGSRPVSPMSPRSSTLGDLISCPPRVASADSPSCREHEDMKRRCLRAH